MPVGSSGGGLLMRLWLVEHGRFYVLRLSLYPMHLFMRGHAARISVPVG